MECIICGKQTVETTETLFYCGACESYIDNEGIIIPEKSIGKTEGKDAYKPYIAVVDSNNQLVIDLALKDTSEPAVIMDGYELIQSDEPMSLIIDEDGKVFLHE